MCETVYYMHEIHKKKKLDTKNYDWQSKGTPRTAMVSRIKRPFLSSSKYDSWCSLFTKVDVISLNGFAIASHCEGKLCNVSSHFYMFIMIHGFKDHFYA